MLRGPCQRLLLQVLGVNSLGSYTARPGMCWLAAQRSDSSLQVHCTSSSRHRGSRAFATVEDYTAEVDAINEKYAEAREEIENAREDAETVYFNESAEEARKIVNGVLSSWQDLLARLPSDEQSKLQRAMGLKMEQLKAELKELDELHA